MAKQKKHTLYTLLGKIGDILLIPIFIISIIVSTMILFQKKPDTVPSIFGVSIVRILSRSMEASNFMVGDTVLLKQTPTNELWVGDIIAFFHYQDPADKGLKFSELEFIDQEADITQSAPQDRKLLKDIQGQGYRVYFHQIIKVQYDESGTRFFVTKGTSNATADAYPVREDLVLGKYIETPQWIRGVMKWLSSSIGMVCCVCVPLGFLVIFQALALIEQINFLYVEKKLMKGEMYWQDHEAQRLIKTGDMENVCKIIYYTKLDEDEQDEFFETVWSFNKKLNKRQQKLVNNAEKSVEILKDKGLKDYYLFWKNNLRWKWDIKQIENELTIAMYSEKLKNDNKDSKLETK